jgi:hypothetical protein
MNTFRPATAKEPLHPCCSNEARLLGRVRGDLAAAALHRLNVPYWQAERAERPNGTQVEYMAICSIPTQGIPLLVSFGDAMNGEVFLRVANVPTLVHVSVTQQRKSYFICSRGAANRPVPGTSRGAGCRLVRHLRPKPRAVGQ